MAEMRVERSGSVAAVWVRKGRESFSWRSPQIWSAVMRARGAGVWVACEFECGVGDAGVGGVLRVGDVMKGKEGGAGDAGVGFGEGLGENGGDGGALGFDFGGGEGLLPPGRRRSRVERRRLPPEGRRSRGLEGSWGS